MVKIATKSKLHNLVPFSDKRIHFEPCLKNGMNIRDSSRLLGSMHILKGHKVGIKIMAGAGFHVFMGLGFGILKGNRVEYGFQSLFAHASETLELNAPPFFPHTLLSCHT